MIDKEKLIEWLNAESEKRKPYSCYDEYHSGMQRMIQDLIDEIEENKFDKEVTP